MTTYLIVDAEYEVDRSAHARYLAIERFDPSTAQTLHPKDERVSPRWPFCRPVAISVLTMVADTDCVLSPLRLETYGLPELDEVSTLRRFHEEVARAGTTATLFTWGGATSDIPELLPAAIHYNSKRTRSERVFRNGRQARYPARRALV